MPVAKINLRRPKHPPSRLTSRHPSCQSSSLYFSSSIFFGETQRPLLLARIAAGKLGGSPGDWGGRMRDQNAQSYRRLELCPERGRPDHGPWQMCLVSPCQIDLGLTSGVATHLLPIVRSALLQPELFGERKIRCWTFQPCRSQAFVTWGDSVHKDTCDSVETYLRSKPRETKGIMDML